MLTYLQCSHLQQNTDHHIYYHFPSFDILILLHSPSEIIESALYQKYSIMSQGPKTRYSVSQLLQILDNPRHRTTPKRREPLLDRDQIRRQMTMKWKDPGYCNLEFSKSSSMRGQLLNQWEIERIALAERSYKTPKEAAPYQFDKESREFPKVTLKLYPKKFQRYLKSVEAQKEDLLFKQKRTVTNGHSILSSLSKQNKEKSTIFMPISTSTKMFGFSSIKTQGSKTRNKHFKTLNL